MHELTVRWDHSPQDGDDLNAFGRNGLSRCAGIHAHDLGGRIILRPLTGKGFPARGASIDLPADAAKLREIAAGLSAIAGQLEPELTTPPPTGPEEGILRVLDMSTSHLSEPSRLWLEDRAYGDSRKLPVVAPTEHGWLLWVPEQADEMDGGLATHGPDSDEPWPEDVRRVLGFAQARACAYLLLDADGPLWDGLWSESPAPDEPGAEISASSAEGGPMVPATDIVAAEHVDQLRDAALDGELDEIDLLATLATDLLIACRAAHRTAPKSCADAVDLITQALARHELLPAGVDPSRPALTETISTARSSTN